MEKFLLSALEHDLDLIPALVRGRLSGLRRAEFQSCGGGETAAPEMESVHLE